MMAVVPDALAGEYGRGRCDAAVGRGFPPRQEAVAAVLVEDVTAKIQRGVRRDREGLRCMSGRKRPAAVGRVVLLRPVGPMATNRDLDGAGEEDAGRERLGEAFDVVEARAIAARDHAECR